MRLINTTTCLFEEFIGAKIPEYAILSHTWQNEEVSFKDMNDGTYKNKKGFRKIEMTCQMAAMEGLQYAWIDTCCIDKSSSAELTEAINSMYRWYQRSKICYVFLSDLLEEAALDIELPECRWFTRGWTLQELLAPVKVHFFNQKWRKVGSKATLARKLSEITGIDVDVLQTVRKSLASIPIATKMSWAAKRETTRIEDRAYSLLGLFDVHMPLLYGEEEQAFRRLQEEIIKTTPDLSIFGWSHPSRGSHPLDGSARVLCGILADSLDAFVGCGSYGLRLLHNTTEFSISNNGIKTRLQVQLQTALGNHAAHYILPLNYCNDSGICLGIRLRKVGPDQFLREDPWTLQECINFSPPSPPRESFFFTQLPRVVTSFGPFISTDILMPQMRSHALQIKLPPNTKIEDLWSSGRFDDEDQQFFVAGVVSGNFDRDCCILKLFASFDVPVGKRTNSFEFDFAFFAIGWSSTLAEDLQCSVVSLPAFATRTNNAYSLIVDWDHDSCPVVRTLINHKVPKFSMAAFDIPETDKSALISYKLRLVNQPNICGNPFWVVEFSSKIIKKKYLPFIEREEWVEV